jgi:hypothetical protein
MQMSTELLQVYDYLHERKHTTFVETESSAQSIKDAGLAGV